MGVQANEGPQGFVDAQPALRPSGRGSQDGQSVAQPVAGAGQLVERVGVEADERLGAALPQPSQMSVVTGAPQPAAHGRR